MTRSSIGVAAAMCHLFGAGSIALLLAGCMNQVRGDPLYDLDAAGRPAREKVALLSGQVQIVDGSEVPPGHLFELMPGCHVVINSAHWTNADSQGSVSANFPPRPFAIEMRAGYSYAIRVQMGPFTGMSSGSIALIAEEVDPNGRVTRRIDSGVPCAGS